MHFLGPAIGYGLVTASILALAAVGFTLQFSVTNILNLAYAEVMSVSGFFALFLNRAGFDIWWCALGAALFGAIFSYVLNRVVYGPFASRGAGLFGMVIVTVAVSIVIQNTVLAIGGPKFFSYLVPAEVTLRPGPFVLTSSEIVVMVVSVVTMFGIHVLLRYTRIGKAMRATAVDASLARACGIRSDLVIDLAWLLSGALAGLAAVALFVDIGTFTFSTASEFIVVIVAAAVLGGVGQPYGAMFGALVIGLVAEVSVAFIDPAYKDIIAFGILVVVLLFRPQGIFTEIAAEKEVAT